MMILKIIVMGALVRLLIVDDRPVLCAVLYTFAGMLMLLPSLFFTHGLQSGVIATTITLGGLGMLIWLLVATGRPVVCAILYILAIVLSCVLAIMLNRSAPNENPPIILLQPCFNIGWSYLYFRSLREIKSHFAWWTVFVLGLLLCVF